MTEQTSACTHQPRYREYYRDGLYKCWECKKIIEELPRTTQIPQQSTEPLDDFKMAVNKLSYMVNNLGINNSFDRTMAKNAIFEINDTFNEYIKSLII